MIPADEERWVPIDGYPNYEVSTHGRIKSYRRSHGGHILAPNYVGRDRSYPQAQLYLGDGNADYIFTAKIVARHFLPGYNEQRLMYFDDNPQNVRVDNLYYISEGFIRTYEGSYHVSRLAELESRDPEAIPF